uniref:Uncharacterized protein n=1 Tax=Anguilla anguilla TaxID=7936 RepID=A0A0E9SBS5_ANGAN
MQRTNLYIRERRRKLLFQTILHNFTAYCACLKAMKMMMRPS